MAGLAVGVAVLLSESERWDLADDLALCALPAFGSGLLEDLTKKIGPLPRLLAAFFAAACAFFAMDAGIYRLDIPLLDSLLSTYWVVALIFTMFAVGGVSHAVNIIDGYNGLSAGVCTIIFGAYAIVAWQVGAPQMLAISLIMIGTLIGFLLWNFPKGEIFAGDGGAYLVGFMVAIIGVLLVKRHPEVSPWFPMVCVAYPVFETIFSIFRRKFLQARAVGQPDALHLHQMIYRRLVRWRVGSRDRQHKTSRNAMTAPYLWSVALTPVVPATIFWDDTPMLIGIFLAFSLKYVWLYWRLVRFRSPRWMILYRPHTEHRTYRRK